MADAPAAGEETGPAALLRRYDPDLFACLIFAREPLRSRLMVLGAYDLELSRAVHGARRAADTGPLIGAMRLQFWRDTLEGAFAGQPPRAHEVAGPLGELIAAAAPAPADLEALIAARDMELAPPLADIPAWAEARYAAFLRLGCALAGAAPPAACGPAGQALGRAFLLRTAAAMAREPGALLADASPAALAGHAREGLGALAEARRARLPAAARPLFLTLWQAERSLAAAAADPEAAAARGLPAAGPARRALALSWRALAGRP
ncbi:squalene/phytoene synthase family protein [Paralimibaculum aggregatum]|uniref:Squalene/phytoene synthase family protein n=1 Tax=Paralimibaculum aggregatum TaxID=3036245 RepID=A0ABQ6LMZ3_9RHOB|nr:squalene/phytoene synthase family protein [Limibaculum sp. NKW23]GMG81640.1 squalene/phytoene synthase family protein [Limibaculum sp. NKW23]